jgi:hypothetical protein
MIFGVHFVTGVCFGFLNQYFRKVLLIFSYFVHVAFRFLFLKGRLFTAYVRRVFVVVRIISRGCQE